MRRKGIRVWVLAVGLGLACSDRAERETSVEGLRAEANAGTKDGGVAPAPAPAEPAAPAKPPPRPDASTSGPPASDCELPLPEGDTVFAFASNVLLAECGRCHAPGASQSAIGPADVRNISILINEGYVVDCSADRSAVIAIMRTWGMPPHDGYAIPDAEIDIVALAIEFGCTDAEKACAGDPSDAGCDDILQRRTARRCGQ